MHRVWRGMKGAGIGRKHVIRTVCCGSGFGWIGIFCKDPYPVFTKHESDLSEQPLPELILKYLIIHIQNASEIEVILI